MTPRILPWLTLALALGGCMADARSDLQTHVAEVDGHDVVYDVVGDGEPAIVFVHGAISTREVWTDARDALAAERRVLTLDLPGHGESAARPSYGTSRSRCSPPWTTPGSSAP